MILLELSEVSICVASICFITHSTELSQHLLEFVDESARQLKRLNTHGYFQEAVHLVFAQKVVVESKVLVHVQEHRLDLDHIVGVRVVEGLVVRALLAPCEKLVDEVLCEGVVFDEVRVVAKVWHHV